MAGFGGGWLSTMSRVLSASSGRDTDPLQASFLKMLWGNRTPFARPRSEMIRQRGLYQPRQEIAQIPHRTGIPVAFSLPPDSRDLISGISPDLHHRSPHFARHHKGVIDWSRCLRGYHEVFSWIPQKDDRRDSRNKKPRRTLVHNDLGSEDLRRLPQVTVLLLTDSILRDGHNYLRMLFFDFSSYTPVSVPGLSDLQSYHRRACLYYDSNICGAKDMIQSGKMRTAVCGGRIPRTEIAA